MTESARILIVDPDDHVVAEYVSRLSNPNWRFDRARTCAEALDLAKRSLYNIAIVDLMLPDIPGTDAWYDLSESHPEMFGILTTSSPSLHTCINPGDRGVLAYLLKPLSMERVCAFILLGLELQNAA